MERHLHSVDGPQLSFDVKRHRELDPGSNPLMLGTLKISGAFRVLGDLNPGEELRVIVQDADGTVITEAAASIEPVAFIPVRDKGHVIGIERRHKAELSDD